MKHYKKNILLFIAIVTFQLLGSAQIAVITGNKSFEISGNVGAFYNYRVLKPGEDDYKNNKAMLRNAFFGFNGRVGNKWEYELNVDVYNLTLLANQDPETPGIRAAYIAYKALPVKIKFGYDKLSYSQGSLTSIYQSAFWSRTQLTRGDFFSRRDIGLTLSSSLWQQRVNLYAGAYTGMGESVFTGNGGDIDPSGSPELVGRIDVSYPSRFRYDEVDYKLSPIPLFRIGANARYENKTQPGTNTVPLGVDGLYGIKLINGKKLVEGIDAAFAYMGFSAQFETQLIKMNPALSTDPLYHNTTADVNKNVVYAGGWQSQANYFWKKAKSVFSFRYESYNINDLVYGSAERGSIAYAYQIDGFNNCIKIQYFKILKEDTTLEPLKWTDQIRIGWQYVL